MQQKYEVILITGSWGRYCQHISLLLILFNLLEI